MTAGAETIAAIATPPGRGAIAIVRCSGPQARQIVSRVFRSRRPLIDRVATYGEIVDGEGAVLDRGLALAMDGPRTATGEDVVELHVHGSPLVAGETLRALLRAGARAAGPGEFTRRAFLNGKLDLSAAEAVADVIAAESRAAALAAQANIAGGLQRAIAAIARPLRALLAELSGSIDYPDEIPEPGRAEVDARLADIERGLLALEGDWERGRLVREGLGVALVGPPNAGKSSLLNALLGEERAIVAPSPGTTRDPIEERFLIDDVVVRVVDTAGLRSSDDPVERLGVARARAVLAGATVALVVLDGSQPLPTEAAALLAETRGRARVVLFNKRDLGHGAFDRREPAELDALSGSAFEPATVAAVRAAIARVGWQGEMLDLARPRLASARQAALVARAREDLARARAVVDAGDALDLLVPDVLAALAALEAVSGAAASEAVLDEVFARFCVGK